MPRSGTRSLPIRSGQDLVQLRILSRRCHQLLVASHIRHPGAVEDNDEIRHPHCAETGYSTCPPARLRRKSRIRKIRSYGGLSDGRRPEAGRRHGRSRSDEAAY